MAISASTIKTKLLHTVPAQKERIRLQEYGIGIFDLVPTRKAWKKAIKKGHVRVNGEAGNTAIWISGGEEIELFIPDPPKPKKLLRLKLKILYEDDYLAAVSKPPGILVSGNSFYTLDNGLEQNLQPSPLSDACRPRPVHRLDYATTGVLLAGKTREAIRKLNKMFEDKMIRKAYMAVTIGNMEPRGMIDLELDGRASITEYVVRQSAPSDRFGILNMVELYPQTGRKHQIRRHLSSIGHPILGDRDYGIEGLILQGKGMYLHAHKLELVHPFTGLPLEIREGMLQRFEKILR